MKKEFIMDNTGFCRFHRNWAEEMIPEIIETLYGMGERFMHSIAITSSRINSRNASMYWESDRNIDLVESFIERRHVVENDSSPDLVRWLDYFKKDRKSAAFDFWFEIRKGIDESLRDFS